MHDIIRSLIHFAAVLLFVILIIDLCWHLWLSYIQDSWFENLKWAHIEIRLPENSFKSLLAMEMIIGNALWQTGGVGTWVAKYWDGKMLQWSSLEIVSLGGRVHFFIRTPAAFRKVLEASIYAQYPQAEIVDCKEDYMNKVWGQYYGGQDSFGTNLPGISNIWGVSLNKVREYENDQKLKEGELPKKDSSLTPDYLGWFFGREKEGKDASKIKKKLQGAPIKTYIDYGLDKIDEKNKDYLIDPLDSITEFMSSLGKDETWVFQILIRPYKKWPGDCKKDTAFVRDNPKYADGKQKMSQYESDLVKTIDLAAYKFGFETNIRLLYSAPKKVWDAGKATQMASLMRQYQGLYNELGGPPVGTKDYDSWEDPWGKDEVKKRGDFIRAVRNRAFNDEKKSAMSTEELATLFHFPLHVRQGQTVQAVETRKGEAPSNLPI